MNSKREQESCCKEESWIKIFYQTAQQSAEHQDTMIWQIIIGVLIYIGLIIYVYIKNFNGDCCFSGNSNILKAFLIFAGSTVTFYLHSIIEGAHRKKSEKYGVCGYIEKKLKCCCKFKHHSNVSGSEIGIKGLRIIMILVYIILLLFLTFEVFYFGGKEWHFLFLYLLSYGIIIYGTGYCFIRMFKHSDGKKDVCSHCSCFCDKNLIKSPNQLFPH